MDTEKQVSAIGDYREAWYGYATDPAIRKRAASGGIVSAVLIHLLDTGRIDGALVCHSTFTEGKLDHEVYVARNRDEILAAQSSKYFDIPVLQGLRKVDESVEKLAVVGLPSQIRSLNQRMLKNPLWRERIAFRIAIFCGHNSKDELVRKVWARKGIPENEIERFYFRQGTWRGEMVVVLKDGSERRMSFQEFSHYQNLHILSLDRCLNCFDHMGYYSDLSTGDIWRQEMRGDPVKHSVFLARTPIAEEIVEEMLENEKLKASSVTRRDVYLSQKRSINYHYAISARARLAKWFGMNIREQIQVDVGVRDYLAATIVLINHYISKRPRLLRLFFRVPRPLVVAYLYLFKGLVNYERRKY